MTHQTLIIKIPPELHRRLAALATEGILGRTLEEVVIHLTRNALHRDWVLRPAPAEIGQRHSCAHNLLAELPKVTQTRSTLVEWCPQSLRSVSNRRFHLTWVMR